MGSQTEELWQVKVRERIEELQKDKDAFCAEMPNVPEILVELAWGDFVRFEAGIVFEKWYPKSPLDRMIHKAVMEADGGEVGP